MGNHLATPITALAIWVAVGTMAVGQAADWNEGVLGHLSDRIGTYDYAAVLGDATVHLELERLLGPDLDLLQERLAVHPTIGLSDNCLALTGNAMRRGGDQMAYLSLCLPHGEIEVALGEAGHVDVYASTNNYSYLSWSMRQWISHYLTIAHRGPGAPSDVTLITR